MPRHFGKSLTAVLLITASLMVVRVALSFTFIGAAVTQTLGQYGFPVGGAPSMLGIPLGLAGASPIAREPSPPRSPPLFIDVKAAVEAHQAGDFLGMVRSGPRFIKVD